MKESVVNQLLAGARAEMDQVQISQSYKEKYARFEANCKEFQKRVEEEIGKKEEEIGEKKEGESPSDIWELYKKTLRSYLSAFQELAECYFEEGFRKGFLMANDLLR